MPIRQLTPPEAAAELSGAAGAVYLDVRTPAEYDDGHPAGAVNVPVFLFDAAGRPQPNPAFLTVVGRHFASGATLIVGCRSGSRSQRACEMLADAGYTDLANVRGGFAGSDDTPGWVESGLPVERGGQRLA